MAVLTANMKSLRDAFNEAFPSRDKSSDGWIGDAAHQGGTSGHNPDDSPYDNAEWDGDPDNISEVRAIDVDKDLRGDVTMYQVVRWIVDHDGFGVLRYIIYDGWIYSALNDWRAVRYTGSNPHDKHAHFSGAYSQTADNRYVDWKFEEINMPSASEIATAVWDRKPWNSANPISAADAIQQASQADTAVSIARDILTGLNAVGARLTVIEERLTALEARE